MKNKASLHVDDTVYKNMNKIYFYKKFKNKILYHYNKGRGYSYVSPEQYRKKLKFRTPKIT